MASLGFRADIVHSLTRDTGLTKVSIFVPVEVWDGTGYGRERAFQLDTGADVTTITAALARTLGLSTIGGRRVNTRGVGGTAPGLLIPFRFRFARWPAVEVLDSSCVVVPGERERGLLALRDVHPRLDLYKVGEDLLLIPV